MNSSLDEQFVYLDSDFIKTLPISIPSEIMALLLKTKTPGACIALLSFIMFNIQQEGHSCLIKMMALRNILKLSLPMMQIAKQELISLGLLEEKNVKDETHRFIGKVLCLNFHKKELPDGPVPVDPVFPSTGESCRRQNDPEKEGDREYTYSLNYLYIYNPNNYIPTKYNIRGVKGGSTIKNNKQIDPIFLDLANQLNEIIKTKRNIKNSPKQIQNWSLEIKKLQTINKINPQRIKRALDWYSIHVGEKYIPVIESGMSLRDKFIKLEEAIKREKEKIEEKRGLSSELLEKVRPIIPIEIDDTLSNKLCTIASLWEEAECIAKERNALQKLPTLLHLLEKYVAFLSASKIKPEPHVFTTTYWAFKKLLKDVSQGIGFDVQTGKRV